MYASKSVTMTLVHVKLKERALYLASFNIGPTHKIHIVIKEQIALGNTIANQHHSISYGLTLFFTTSKAIKLCQINIT